MAKWLSWKLSQFRRQPRIFINKRISRIPRCGYFSRRWWWSVGYNRVNGMRREFLDKFLSALNEIGIVCIMYVSRCICVNRFIYLSVLWLFYWTTAPNSLYTINRIDLSARVGIYCRFHSINPRAFTVAINMNCPLLLSIYVRTLLGTRQQL